MDGVERDVRTLARQIAEAGSSERTRVYHMTWWADRLLDWAMAHDDFRTQLFRFVDVFPACTDDADVVRHLDEYFEGIDLPTALDLGLEAAEHVPFGARLGASVTRRNIRRMARQFIAGETADEATGKLRELWRLGEAATVDLLGEKTVTQADAERYAARVHELLDVLARESATWPDDPQLERDPWGAVPRVNVSVKPTALAPHFAPLTRERGLVEAFERMEAICAHAADVGGAVYLDMEHYDVRDISLELIRRLGERFPEQPQLGCVIQAYLKDALADLAAVIHWSSDALRTKLNVRLVKGAYWDYETITAGSNGWPSPVFETKGQTDENYERCVDLLVARAGDVRPAFATHNIRQVAYAIAATRARGLHDTAVELQLLYGMAEPVHAALRKLGLRVRAYAPVGELVPGMAYLVRRLLENTANESFLRHRFAEHRDLDALIAPPDPSPPAPAPPREGFVNEPVREWRRGDARERFGSAVAKAVSAPTFEAPVLIGGRAIRTSDTIVSSDPAESSRVVCTSGRATTADAELAIELAVRAQPRWATVGKPGRAEVIRRAAALMRERRDELAALEVLEAGKPWAQADADVCEAIDFCEYYARELMRLFGGAHVEQVPGESNYHAYRPRGLVAVISPWNFPLAIPCGMVTAALVCGNAVLFKPAEQTPGIAYRLVQILHEAGVPTDVLAFLPGIGEEVGAHLVDHADTSVIAFTGSKDVGLHIVERAGITSPTQRHTKRVVAEMGGKNAIVVDTDADLDVAVPAVIESAFGYAGQKCSAASRLIGVGSVYDALVERVVEAARIVPVGLPRDMTTVVGPVIDEDAWKKVRRYQEIARDEGEVLLQREDVPPDGWFVGPTVAAAASPSTRIATDEIFGPLLTCLRADDFEHAIEIANAPPYALTGGVFSRSPSRIRRASHALRAGNVYVNRAITGAMVGRQPFGGFGLSGGGTKAGGADYLLSFVDPFVVTENTIRQGFAPQERPT
jgi:RHH-type transcriptional regulator, proline utilization regulon repressor / proline dehydrogenase / delta 1-pyrroline-5-carboxylate dehydrogenase